MPQQILEEPIVLSHPTTANGLDHTSPIENLTVTENGSAPLAQQVPETNTLPMEEGNPQSKGADADSAVPFRQARKNKRVSFADTADNEGSVPKPSLVKCKTAGCQGEPDQAKPKKTRVSKKQGFFLTTYLYLLSCLMVR